MKRLLIIFLLMFGMSLVFADCDMMTMISRDGYYLSGNNSTYDLFNFIRVRSNNSLPKKNDDGYGFIYYPSDGSFNYGDQSWFQTDPTSNDNTFYTNDGSPGWDPAWQDSLDAAEDYIMDVNTEATIVLGHARQGSVGEGSHPFYFEYSDKTYTLMHNGTLTNDIKTPMYTYLYNLELLNNSNWGANPEYISTWIDSEIFFLYLMHFIESNNGNVVEGFHDALTKENLPYVANSNIRDMLKNPESYYNSSINDSTYKKVANIVLSDGMNLYVFRNSPSVGASHPTHDPYHNLSYEEDNNIITVKTLDDLDTRIDQFDFVVISRDEDPIEYPNFLDSDIKIFSPGVHWISFPVLTEDGIYEVPPNNSIPPIDNQLFQQAYFENGHGGLLQLTYNSPGTIDEFTKIEGNRYGTPMSIEPDGPNFAGHDVGFGNMLFRHEGYKISVGEVNEPTILQVGSSGNERLPENHIIAGDMQFGEYHWIGYWLMESQNIVDAFGGNSSNPNENLWQYVEKVKAEDWYYDRCSIIRGIGEAKPKSWSTVGKTLEYGKMYMVWFLDETIENFRWYHSGSAEEPEERPEPEYFSYTEKPDYEVIDIVSIPENIIEIGVFQDEICMGAVVVRDSCEQILVYSSYANRDEIPFSFEIVTTNREQNLPIHNYSVYNRDSGEFEAGYIVAGRQESSIVRFGDINQPQNETPIIGKALLYNNYPNPFNPETEISFSIPTEQKIKLAIYNLKGQKVKELVNGQFISGTHSVIWNGTDENGKKVGSGLYLYRLKTDDLELTRKMLLLK